MHTQRIAVALGFALTATLALTGGVTLAAAPEANEAPTPAEASPTPQAGSEADTEASAAKIRVKPFGIRLSAELGALGVPAHHIQFGTDGSRFDYVEEGGQNNLFLFLRFEIDLQVDNDHHVTFLYQPLSLTSEVVLPRTIRADGIDFAQGTPTTVTYDFPFFRASYWFDFFEDPRYELSFGGGLQIRNATISLSANDGSRLVSRRDIGPVPLLKFRGRYGFDDGWWIGFEADGFYAPISVLNGSDTEVTGAILDLSLRGGYQLGNGAELFMNLRWIGGGAVGQSDPQPPGDGFQKNWLHFVALSIGMHYQIL